MSSRFRAALVAATLVFLLALQIFVYQHGYLSVERIQQFFSTFCHWHGKTTAHSFAGDEYLLGTGKADITGYIPPTPRKASSNGNCYMSDAGSDHKSCSAVT